MVLALLSKNPAFPTHVVLDGVVGQNFECADRLGPEKLPILLH